MIDIKTSLAVSLLILPLVTFAAPAAVDDAAETGASTVHKAIGATDKAAPAAGGGDLALAKASQNPLAAMISVPFQNNANFNAGPDDDTQNVLLFQPVIPFDLNDDWNIIGRMIMPITTQPGSLTKEQGSSKTGIGNTQIVAYFSPKETFHDWTWGVSPVLMLPASDDNFGSKEWGGGFSVVALTMPGKWVYGGLVTQLWAPSGDDSSQITSTSLQYFINYNLSDGWYLSSAPTMTYNWRADAGDRWTVPMGGGVGRIVHWGKQPINISLRAYGNVVKPTSDSSDWTLQTQFTWMFPKK